ncbi:unnamed protein product [Prunus armeniaca]
MGFVAAVAIGARTGPKMTGQPPSTHHAPQQPSRRRLLPENTKFQAGFYPDFPELVPAIPVGNSIYELKFGRFRDSDSGHFRSVFGVCPRTKVTPNIVFHLGRSLEPRFGDFPAMGYRFGHPRAASACGGAWAL